MDSSRATRKEAKRYATQIEWPAGPMGRRRTGPMGRRRARTRGVPASGCGWRCAGTRGPGRASAGMRGGGMPCLQPPGLATRWPATLGPPPAGLMVRLPDRTRGPSSLPLQLLGGRGLRLRFAAATAAWRQGHGRRATPQRYFSSAFINEHETFHFAKAG